MNIPLTLTTINEDALGKIFEKLNFRSIFTLRKVCRDLRNYIDDVTPDIKISTLAFDISKESVEIRADHCIIEKYEISEEIPEHFQKILKHQKSPINEFWISASNFENIDKFFENFTKKFSGKLQKVKFLQMRFVNQTHLLSIFRFIDPKFLERVILIIDHFGKEVDFGEIVHLEQWKNLKEACMENFCVNVDLANFKNFDDAKIRKHSICLADVKFLKEMFISPTSTCQFFRLNFTIFAEKEQIMNFLGTPEVSHPLAPNKEWVFRVAQDNEVLYINLYDPILPEGLDQPVGHFIEFSKLDEADVIGYYMIRN